MQALSRALALVHEGASWTPVLKNELQLPMRQPPWAVASAGEGWPEFRVPKRSGARARAPEVAA